jgi:type III restriction enzyme
VHIEDQKRLLIINAVALSEYRRLLAEKDIGQYISPIVLIKSKKISQSVEDRDFFDKVIESIRPEDLDRLKEITRDNKGREHEILSDMFKWLGSKSGGLVSNGDWDGLKAFVAEIKSSFARENTLIYNSQQKENPDLLTNLDNPLNNIRAIFSVKALNEGWDVLSLFDIIHFDISETKKVSLQDIQLIGRGARYCPFELPRRYKVDSDSELSLFGGSLEFDKYKRKFDNDPYDRGRVLETFVYHFVKTGTFLENLQKDLLGEGIMNEGVEKKTINLKYSFVESETYKKGFVLVNSVEKRKKTATKNTFPSSRNTN